MNLGSNAMQKLFKFVAPIVVRVCHYLGGDMGGGGSRPKVTKCDKGEGGSKITIFGVTYFLNGPIVF